MAKDPYKGSNYDAAGMPLGATYVDCDNAEEVRQAMVKDKVVEPQNHVYDLDYKVKVEKPKEYKSDAELNEEKDINKFAVGIPGIDSNINRADTSIRDYTEIVEHGNTKKVSIGESYDDILETVLEAPKETVVEEDTGVAKEENDGKV